MESWRRCMQTVDPALSIRECSKIIESGAELPENAAYAYVYRGEANAYCRRDAAAKEDFGKAAQLAPQLGHPHYGLGQLLLRSESYAAAEGEFGKAIQSDGEDADIGAFTHDSLGRFAALPLTQRGFARYKQGNVAQALADYTEAMKICPTCGAPARNIGFLLSAQRKFDEAAAQFDRAISIDMRAPESFWGRGTVLALAARYAPAVASYSEAIRLNPKFVPAYRNRASAAAKLGNGSMAAEDTRQAATIEQAAEIARKNKCERVGATDDGSSGEDDEDKAEVSSGAVDAAALDDAAITTLFSGKKWQARLGLWQADIEFRRDGSFRQQSADESRGGKLAVTTDGAWAVSRGRLCIYTNATLCLIAHVVNGNVALARDDGTQEYSGAAAKLQSLTADDTTSPIKEYALDEQLLPGTQKDAAAGKTLLYFIHGFSGSPRMHTPIAPYFIRRIQENEGWDVIDADFPARVDTQVMYGPAPKLAAATYLARRLKELKSKGYRHIFVGGQSAGGWTALDLAAEPGLPLDGTILLSPGCCAWRYGNDADRNSAEFANNKIYFEQAIARVRYPTVAILFEQDDFEPADRGAEAAAILSQHGVPNLVIDHPPGFQGHGAGWLPIFDFVYRDCIVAFLKAPKTGQCKPPALVRDFRVMLTAAQLGNWQAARLSAAQVIGREFAIYPTGAIYKIVSGNETQMKDYDFGEGVLTSAFRDGRYCVRGRIKYQLPASTDEVCTALIKWSDREVLALDEASGAVAQWWVEQK